MIFSRYRLLATVLSLSLTSVVLAADVSESCVGCHGKDGASTDKEIPSIGGLSATYLNATFEAYKGKTRPCVETSILTGEKKDTKTDMCKIVAALSADEIKSVVTFYSKKKFIRSAQTADAALAAKGKTIHEKSCEKCHSEGGSLATDDSGILAGQRMGYLSTTFKEFTEEKRPMSKDKMKKHFVGDEALDKESTDALIQYYGSFK